MSYITKRNTVLFSRIRNINLLSSFFVVAVMTVNTYRLAMIWNDISTDIGVHFDSYGNFDVFADKQYAAYPIIIAAVSLLICDLVIDNMEKLPFGFKLTHKAWVKVMNALALLFDAVKMSIGFVFAWLWSDSVILQESLNVSAVKTASDVLFISFLAAAVYIVLTVVRQGSDEDRS